MLVESRSVDKSANTTRNPILNTRQNPNYKIPKDIRPIFQLFFEGRTPPYKRRKEVEIGIGLHLAAKHTNAEFSALGNQIGMSAEFVPYILGGIFKREEVEPSKLNALAEILNTNIYIANKIGADIFQMSLNKPTDWENDYGPDLLLRRLHEDEEKNPELYKNAIIYGSGIRQKREWSSREVLARRSKVSHLYLTLLEHGYIPEKFLSGVQSIANKLHIPKWQLWLSGASLVEEAITRYQAKTNGEIADAVKIILRGN